MVGALGVRLAVRLAKRLLIVPLALTVIAAGHIGHIATGFGQGRLRLGALDLVPATRTGVRRRCQLDCQEQGDEEANEPRAPAGRVTQR